MLETIMNLVRQHAGSAISSNAGIPQGQNNQAIEAVSGGILSGLQQQATSGGLGNLLGMLTGKSESAHTEVTQGVQQNVQQSLIEKLGITPQMAMSIAAMVVPMILSKLSQKAQDPNDSSVDTNTVMEAATGKQGTDWMSMAQSAMADGKLDMSDLTRIMSGQGNSGQSGQSSGGGLGGMLGGLFGNR